MGQRPVLANGRLTIDLSAIVANWRKLARKATHGNCAAVVKADAYGLGAVTVSRTLLKAGCRDFFVATLDEAIEVRNAIGPQANIYTFDGFHTAADAHYRKHRIAPVINTPQQVKAWNAKRHPIRPALHLDTGMTRLGLSGDEFSALHLTGDLAILNPELVISHFACADEPADAMNDRQISAFTEMTRHFPQARKSLANSAGCFMGRKAQFDLLRPGISLYGGEAVNGVKNPMKPVVTLEGRILQVRRAKQGETIGYGASHRFKRDSIIATIGVGYADGFHRAASGAGTPLRKARIGSGATAMIGRHVCPILGRVSMDTLCIDITDLPAATIKRLETGIVSGEAWAALINAKITVDAVARAAGTIGYEVLTSLGKRYERVYLQP